MSRILRSPALLMTAYIALFSWDGPWLASASYPAHRNDVQIVIAVLLAVFAARGSRPARVVMITYSIYGVLVLFVGTSHVNGSTLLGTILLALMCYVAEVGLLVSTPMYRRTRPEGARDEVAGKPFLPRPPVSVVLAGVIGGFAMALVPFSDGLRETVCSAGRGSPAGPCLAPGYGYPVAYRYPWHNLAPRGTSLAAFSTDWMLWGVSILLVTYLVQLNRSREYAELGEAPAEPVGG